MKTITLTQLRRQPRKVRTLVQRHGEVVVTVRGKPSYVASKIRDKKSRSKPA
jgi:hypothetical protein